MKVTHIENVPKVKVEMEGARGAFKQIPISTTDGTPSLSLRVFTIEPGGHTPYHSHPYEHLNYVIEGNGVLVSENEEPRPISQGDFALILPNEVHQYRNTSSDQLLCMICAVPKEFE